MGQVGVIMGWSGGVMGHLGAFIGHLWVSMGYLGVTVEQFGACYWAAVGNYGGHMDHSGAVWGGYGGLWVTMGLCQALGKTVAGAVGVMGQLWVSMGH